jgi:hypothetical protein
MTRAELNAAIRKAPEIWVRFSFGAVELKKNSLTATVNERFNQGPLQETGLTLEGGNVLAWDFDRCPDPKNP